MSTYRNEVIFVRSVDRTLGSPSNFSVNLPKLYNNVVGLALISAEIPYSFGNITASYSFNVRFSQAAPTAIIADYVVPVGTYAITDIQAHLLAFLQVNFPALSVTAVTYNQITGRLTVDIGLATGVLLVSKGPDLSPRLCNVLGIDPGLTTTSVYANGVNTLAFPLTANLQPQSCLLLKIQNVPSNIVTTNGASALFRIQINTTAGSIIFLNNAANIENTVSFASPVNSLSYLIVNLALADNSEALMQGCEHTFALQITYTQ